ILKFTKKTRSVFLSILGISWFWFFGGAAISLFPPYCKNVLNTHETVVTLFLACFSVGIAVGSLLCERLSRRSIELGLVPLGSIGISLFTFDLGLATRPEVFGSSLVAGANYLEFLRNPHGIRVVADLLLLSIFSGFFIVPLYAMMQDRSELSQRSRIIAGNNIINAAFMVVSAILIAALQSVLTIPQIFLCLAILNGIVAIYIYTLLPEFLLRFMTWIFANILYRLRVVGEENIPDKGPAILVCNHVSFVDWLIIGAGIHRPVRFVMHYSFARGWLAKRILKRAKVISIASAKEDLSVLEAAFESISRELRDNEIVCIFPEGQITHDGKLSPFKAGIER
ncbi:glycerol acyltransferase, partial [bacterium]|nr:glycerol acyltransferase [bacterium]